MLKQKARLLQVQRSVEQEMKSYMTEKAKLALAKKQEVMDEVKRLYKEGVGLFVISWILQLHWVTVKKYLQME